MARTSWKVGNRVKIKQRAVKDKDREELTYFDHLGGLTGTIQNIYSKSEIAVALDTDELPKEMAEVHKQAVKRMRAKFLDGIGEEQKRGLTAEEKRFDANYVVLVGESDIAKGPAKKKSKANSEDDEDEDEFDPTSVKQGELYDDASIPDRKSAKDLDAAEEAELKRRTRKTMKR